MLNSDELREIYKRLVGLLTDYHTEMGQNIELYEAYQRLADRDDFSSLSQAQQQSIKHILRSFKLSGVALPEAEKQTYSELKKKLDYPDAMKKIYFIQYLINYFMDLNCMRNYLIKIQLLQMMD